MHVRFRKASGLPRSLPVLYVRFSVQSHRLKLFNIKRIEDIWKRHVPITAKDQSLVTENDVNHVVGNRVLGVIPQAGRCGRTSLCQASLGRSIKVRSYLALITVLCKGMSKYPFQTLVSQVQTRQDHAHARHVPFQPKRSRLTSSRNFCQERRFTPHSEESTEYGSKHRMSLGTIGDGGST